MKVQFIDKEQNTPKYISGITLPVKMRGIVAALVAGFALFGCATAVDSMRNHIYMFLLLFLH